MSRRLNRTEYSNTIRDLVGLDLHPGDDLPEDGSGGEGFNTDGNALFVSSIQVEKYLQAADKIVRAALPDGAGVQAAAEAARQRVLVAMPGPDLPPRDAARQDMPAFARRAFRRPVERL